VKIRSIHINSGVHISNRTESWDRIVTVGLSRRYEYHYIWRIPSWWQIRFEPGGVVKHRGPTPLSSAKILVCSCILIVM